MGIQRDRVSVDGGFRNPPTGKRIKDFSSGWESREGETHTRVSFAMAKLFRNWTAPAVAGSLTTSLTFAKGDPPGVAGNSRIEMSEPPSNENSNDM